MRHRARASFRSERLLARLFFGRFFESDGATGIPQAQLVIWAIAGLATPGFMMALYLGRAYRVVVLRHGNILDMVLRDQLLYVTFSIAALGIVALVTWESVFPDRRDVRVLDILPLPTRAHVVGRLTALGGFAALFAIGINAPSSVAYGGVLRVFSAADWMPLAIVAHLVATALAGAFGFFTVILGQGILLNLFGRTIARRLALALQALFVVALLQALLFTPFMASRISGSIGTAAPSNAWLLPPAAFLALYDLLAGTHRPTHAGAAAAAIAMTGIVAVASAALVAGSYRRLVRIALEAPDGGNGRSQLVRGFSRWLAAAAPVNPVSRAVAAFTVQSLIRSRTHLTLLATYAGLAAAIVIATMIPDLVSNRLLSRDTPNIALLAAPLVMYFFVLAGLRALIGIPTIIKANWVFRIHAPEHRIHDAMRGVRLVFVFGVVLPIAAVCGLAGLWLWGALSGATYFAFTAALGCLLADVLLLGLRKIPFACTYFPGRSRAPKLWPIYAGALLVYAYLLGNLELMMMSRPPLLIIVFVLLVAVVVAVMYIRRRILAVSGGLVYVEEDPDRLFEGFGLSEGLAAESLSQD